MADLEAVLADVSYLMALEKSKSSSNQNRTSKRMTLPDASVRSVMIRYLQDRDELKFETLIKQKLAFLLFKDFCVKNQDVRFEVYDKIDKLKFIHSAADRKEAERVLIDSYFFNSTLMILISKPIVFSETVTEFLKAETPINAENQSQNSSNNQVADVLMTTSTSTISSSNLISSNQNTSDNSKLLFSRATSTKSENNSNTVQYIENDKNQNNNNLKLKTQSLDPGTLSDLQVTQQVVREYSIPEQILEDIRKRSSKVNPTKTVKLTGMNQSASINPNSENPEQNSRREHELLTGPLKSLTDEELKNVYENFPFNEIAAYLWLYLKHTMFDLFLQSENFVRFCQWKNVELSIQLSMNDFSVHRIIGRGGFGEVYGCRKADTGKMYAMKCLDKKRIKMKSGEQLALNERFILQVISTGSDDCPFIVGMTYAFTTPYKVCFLLDLMNGGDLHYHLTQHIFTEEEVKFYVAEIALGLEHMHSRGVVYRDLKPANILLTEQGHVRISDLGLACDFITRRPHASVGTHGYMAPEVLQRGVPYDSSADWFSLACMIYKLLRGQSPFRPHRNKDKYEIDRLTLAKEVEIPSSFSDELKDLLIRLFKGVIFLLFYFSS